MNLSSKILVVDDTDFPREVAVIFLKKLGFQNIFSECNVFAARKILAKEKIDLVITDFLMPEINGIEFAKEVIDNYKIPVLLMSGNLTDDVVLNAKKVGVVQCLWKPLNFDEFEKAVCTNCS